MQLVVAILCEAATVREGLLNILSGGITTIHRPNYPNVLGLQLALVVQPDSTSSAEHLKLEIAFEAEDENVPTLASMSVTGISGTVGATNDPFLVPLVVPLPFFVPGAGRYEVNVTIDNEAPVRLPITARVQEPPKPAPVPPRRAARPAQTKPPASKAAKTTAKTTKKSSR